MAALSRGCSAWWTNDQDATQHLAMERGKHCLRLLLLPTSWLSYLLEKVLSEFDAKKCDPSVGTGRLKNWATTWKIPRQEVFSRWPAMQETPAFRGKIHWRRDGLPTLVFLSFPSGSAGKESARLQCGRPGFDPWVGEIPWRRKRLPIPVFWPGEFHRLYSPWGCKESDTTEQLSLSKTTYISYFLLRLFLGGGWYFSKTDFLNLMTSFESNCFQAKISLRAL